MNKNELVRELLKMADVTPVFDKRRELMKEAADKIDKSRAALEKLARLGNELEAENKRLKEELAGAQKKGRQLICDKAKRGLRLDALEIENKRLTKQIDEVVERETYKGE